MDIKPSNILLESGSLKVKLIDFGTAYQLTDDCQTLRGSRGTINFMSPECLRSEEDYLGKPSDVWSLGVTFYCLTSNVLPFQADSMFGLVNSISKGSYGFVNRVPGVNDRYCDVITSMLQLNPRDRTNISEVIDALNKIQ